MAADLTTRLAEVIDTTVEAAARALFAPAQWVDANPTTDTDNTPADHEETRRG